MRTPLVPVTIAFLLGTLCPAPSAVWLGLLLAAAGLGAWAVWARPKAAWAGTAALLLSLLLGERVALDERLKQAFVETGTIHLVPTQMGRKFEAISASYATV